MPERSVVSLATARVVPTIVTLLLGYLTFVVVGSLSIDYLINPPDDREPRVEAALGIILIYFLLLLPVLACWFRLLQVLILAPGYEPLGDPEWSNLPVSRRPGMQRFYEKDVFVCDYKGTPKWCDHCHNWKSDRSHHSMDVGRCSLKMDHFCPWVGGVVGERSYKFFIQFLCYATLLTTFCLILFAYFVSETRGYANWIVALGLVSFFSLFMTGMIGNSLWMTLQNLSSCENADKGPSGRAVYFAVILPPQLQEGARVVQEPAPARTSTSRSTPSNGQGAPSSSDLTDPAHTSYFDADVPSRRLKQKMNWVGTVTYPLQEPDTERPPLPAPITRKYAILETRRGANPWDLGSPFLNFKQVFGEKLHDWLLPIKYSPCCDHTSAISMYQLGVQFEDLLVEAGLIRPRRRQSKTWEASPAMHTGGRRQKTRRLPQGWENGERPPGWESQREARRQRREERA